MKRISLFIALAALLGLLSIAAHPAAAAPASVPCMTLGPSMFVVTASDAISTQPISRADIRVYNTAGGHAIAKGLTDVTGYWKTPLAQGTYLVTVAQAGYVTYQKTLTVSCQPVTKLPATLQPISTSQPDAAR